MEISNILGEEYLNKFNAKQLRSERAELIKYFCDGVLNKKGKKYPPAFIASKLAPYSLKDLYYMTSECRDYVNRGGNIGKYFWSLFK